MNYLRMSFGSFSSIIHNSVHLSQLIQLQEQREANKKAAETMAKEGIAVHPEITPIRHDLSYALWAEMQVCNVRWECDNIVH